MASIATAGSVSNPNRVGGELDDDYSMGSSSSDSDEGHPEGGHSSAFAASCCWGSHASQGEGFAPSGFGDGGTREGSAASLQLSRGSSDVGSPSQPDIKQFSSTSTFRRSAAPVRMRTYDDTTRSNKKSIIRSTAVHTPSPQGTMKSLLFWAAWLFLAADVKGLDPLPANLKPILNDWFGSKNSDVVEKYGNIENWDTSSVTNMQGAFDNKGSFNGDLSLWDTSKVTNMAYMFRNAKAFDGDLAKWQTSSVTTMNSMFESTDEFSGRGLSNWNVEQVTDMHKMFGWAKKFNGDVSAWTTTKVTRMSEMFRDTNVFTCDLSQWQVGEVTSMSSMFCNAKAFNSDVTGWDVTKVTNMNGMFQSADAFTGVGLASWNVGSVTHMNWMFYQSVFDGNISNWNVGRVIEMKYMFEKSLFNQDISKWDVSSVTQMDGMFMHTPFFDSDISKVGFV